MTVFHLIRDFGNASDHLMERTYYFSRYYQKKRSAILKYQTVIGAED